jgi:hypothetical protein
VILKRVGLSGAFLEPEGGSHLLAGAFGGRGGGLYLKGPVNVKVDGVGLPRPLVDDVEGVDDPGADLRDGPHRRLAHHLPAVQDVLGPHRPTHRHLMRVF